MCLQEVRECPACKWRRTWHWRNCKRYARDLRAACAEAKPDKPMYAPEECKTSKARGPEKATVWVFKVPPLQCANTDCPDKARVGEALHERDERLRLRREQQEAEKRRKQDEKEREEEEARKRQDVFMGKHYVRKLVHRYSDEDVLDLEPKVGIIFPARSSRDRVRPQMPRRNSVGCLAELTWEWRRKAMRF